VVAVSLKKKKARETTVDMKKMKKQQANEKNARYKPTMLMLENAGKGET